jgi:AcrR family transcriptional regulator
MSDSAAGRRPAEADESTVRGDTRARIQQVAVQLFAEQGYEKTSLREIADRLSVTKAALYYHFQSKEDIVASLVAGYYAQIDGLIAWAQSQPRTPGLRREIVVRYVGILAAGDEVFRMLHQNQASVQGLAAAKKRGPLFAERMDSLVDLLTGPDAPLAERLRAAMALGGASVGWMFFAARAADHGRLREQVSRIACELIEAVPDHAGG